ncbi:hypothetical protein GOP47_0000780 [Adiantum capillus-veneris]|uniref:Uncharacterized protein n=1 Tax=Adiantum capillus-veneris TaxID=13818 RepID=A0A9D4ZSL7_ADICA|nr:hypothetical protein GOP47_0000780 [Adiantum capillus-veneris]
MARGRSSLGHRSNLSYERLLFHRKYFASIRGLETACSYSCRSLAIRLTALSWAITRVELVLRLERLYMPMHIQSLLALLNK